MHGALSVVESYGVASLLGGLAPRPGSRWHFSAPEHAALGDPRTLGTASALWAIVSVLVVLTPSPASACAEDMSPRLSSPTWSQRLRLVVVALDRVLLTAVEAILLSAA